tara:strand:+ start:3499 stop:4293 length:795 start_codon:yes stop_codon:yes gene_type:complete
MLENKCSVISFSGGMDSTSLLLHLLSKKHDIYAISFKYGQKHVVEVELAKKNITYLKNNGFQDQITHKVFDISNILSNFNSSLIDKSQDIPEGFYESDSMKTTFVPNRNAIFFSLIYGYAISLAKNYKEKISISIGAHSGDHAIYPDCRLFFFEQLFKSFQIGNWDSESVELYVPYISMDKKEILIDAEKSVNNLNLDFDTIFKNTITSYSPDNNGISSGKTGSDIERILAFNSLNKKDPIQYQSSWEDVLDNALKTEKNFISE